LEHRVLEAEGAKKASQAEQELRRENQELLTEIQRTNDKCQ
jgi:hypothetical protein